MKIKIIFSRTVVTQVDYWPEFRNVEIEVPDYLSTENGWHAVGALTEEQEERRWTI